MNKILAGFILGAFTIAGSAADQSDPWAPLRAFVGKWQGPETGEPGKGLSTREYHFDLAGRFLSARNRSEWEPKSPAAKPEIHEDFSMFSYDRALKKLVLRQFHVEGFVNEYTLQSSTADGKRLEFVTVRMENSAPGWRAKESYEVISPDELLQTFSLAAPGKDFAIYTQARLKRVE